MLSRMSEQEAPSTVRGTVQVKRGLAEMLKGGVIMDVVDAEQARIAEDAGACAVMALERVPSDIRRDGGVARMSDPEMIEGIKAAVTIPVMAKARIGHFAEAQVLQALEVDYVDESEVLTPADETHHIDKWAFNVPFVCGATILVEWAKRLQAPLGLVQEIHDTGWLPVPLFCAGGIATPADASLAMQLGAEAVFVGSGIFKSEEPQRMAQAIVEATTNYDDPLALVRVSRGLGKAMAGLELASLDVTFADRGW